MTERQVSAPGRDRTLCAHCGKELRFHGAVGAWCPAHEATFTPLASSSPEGGSSEQRLAEIEDEDLETVARLFEQMRQDAIKGGRGMMLSWEDAKGFALAFDAAASQVRSLSAQVRSLREVETFRRYLYPLTARATAQGIKGLVIKPDAPSALELLDAIEDATVRGLAPIEEIQRLRGMLLRTPINDPRREDF